MNLVVDCSFIMGTVLSEENEMPIPYNLYKIYAPSIFYLECSNVLLTSINRKKITELDYQEYSETIRNLPISIDKISSEVESLQFIFKLAKVNTLSSYDASYLELAIRIKAKVATFDKILIKACDLNSIEIINRRNL